MISQLLREKILELTKNEEVCSQALARIRFKKEKLILFLYETENNQDFSLKLLQDENLDSLILLDRSIESLTNDSKELTRQLQTGVSLSENVPRVAGVHGQAAPSPPVELTEQEDEQQSKASFVEQLDPKTVADLILDQIKKMQLWSFGITYMAQVLNLKPTVISQGLRQESYSRFWHLKKKATTDTLETWITDLDLINSLCLIEVEREGRRGFPALTNRVVEQRQKDSDSPTSDKKEGLRKGRSRRAFKRSLPPNSTDDLVEKSSSVMDLLNRVFESNRGKQLDAIGILDYLYPGQTKDWSKEERRFRVQLVSRELCTSIKKGNWRRISVGVYSHA